MRYSSLYALRSQRAIDVALADVSTLIAELAADGVPPERVNEILVDDLETNGPIFGRFFRSIVSAGEVAVSLAEFQAALTGDDAGGDPVQLEAGERSHDPDSATWVCVSHREMDRCMALHGVTKTRGEWTVLGLRPRLMHSRCVCELVPPEQSEEFKSPLLRNTAAGQGKGCRLTSREDNDERAESMRQRALASAAGRAVLEAINHGEKQ